jgi:hypothetical protein
MGNETHSQRHLLNDWQLVCPAFEDHQKAG